jgi:hypothetical protein
LLYTKAPERLCYALFLHFQTNARSLSFEKPEQFKNEIEPFKTGSSQKRTAATLSGG